MNRVYTQQFESEAMLAKRENRLLWVMVVFLSLSLFYKEWQTERVLARITPQSVEDACNRSMNNGLIREIRPSVAEITVSKGSR